MGTSHQSFHLSPFAFNLSPQDRRLLLNRGTYLTQCPPSIQHLKPYTLYLSFFKHYRKLIQIKEKSPKVHPVLPDKEFEGKITVRKGGWYKRTDCLPFKTINKQDL